MDDDPSAASEHRSDASAAEELLAELTSERFATFGFGSNSVSQLRGRLGDQRLRGWPGRIRGQALAFAGPNRTWALEGADDQVGTATLIPSRDDVALGTVAFLSGAQLATLDGYEGAPRVYTQRHFVAEVYLGGHWIESKVVAYIKQDSSRWFRPSEAYCCAVLRNLRGSFPALRTLVLRDTAGQVRETWQHPGHLHLGLSAFLFELGVRKKTPWTLPAEIQPALELLRRAGVTGTVQSLLEILGTDSHNLPEEEVAIARKLLRVGTSAQTRPDSDSDDETQAECAFDAPLLTHGPADDGRHASTLASLLDVGREHSCAGTLLVSTGQPLSERITMLGGMLAHPCVGVYPYRDGPATTVVAAHQAAAEVPRVFSDAVARLGARTCDLFFVVSDVSAGRFASSAALNVLHHPWCYESIKPGGKAGAGRAWHIGLHVPSGGAVTAAEKRARCPPDAPREDAVPDAAPTDTLQPLSVHVHPGAGGELCCSPNNVRLALAPATAAQPPPAAAFWAACVEDRAGAAASGGAPRACASLHWLVTDGGQAQALARAAGAAASLGHFLGAAAGLLGAGAAPVREAAAALGWLGAAGGESESAGGHHLDLRRSRTPGLTSMRSRELACSATASTRFRRMTATEHRGRDSVMYNV